MQPTINISDLSGIATITRTGGVSLLCTGELSTFRPFEALMSGFDLRMGIKCSQLDYNKAARNSFDVISKDGRVRTFGRKQRSNQILVNKSTLLKHINPMMFMGLCSQHTVAEVTGKKPTYKAGGKMQYSNLSVEEELWCNAADWAYNAFGTLHGVSVVVSLNNGVKLVKQY